jgi:hypothetical protein
MMLTRRRLLWGSAGVAAGLLTTSCSLVGAGRTGRGLPASKDVAGALRDLAKQAGRETFQSVRIFAGWWLVVELLTADGGVQEYTYRDKGWTKGRYREKTLLTSPSSVAVSDLPLDRLARYADAVPRADQFTLDVDYVGRLRVMASVKAELVGLTPDGRATVPDLSPDAVDDVRTAVAEMVAAYGSSAVKVGSFNGFVHMDANVAGCQAGVRIVRYPRIAAKAGLAQKSLFDSSVLFDPTGFDPTTAVTRKATIGREAGVEGTVWDWQYGRPPRGGDPVVSFGIGPKGPSTRVWLDANGKVAAVLGGQCKSDTGWCPK